MVLTPCSMRWIHIPCSTSHDALFPFVGADPISFRYAFRDVDPFSLCIAPCSRGNGFLSSRCLSHAPWGPYFLPRMPLSSRTWFPPRISLFLEVLILSLGSLLTSCFPSQDVHLLLRSWHPPLGTLTIQRANSLLKCAYDFEVIFNSEVPLFFFNVPLVSRSWLPH